jgi:uncharacterized protein (TIGR03435 family)
MLTIMVERPVIDRTQLEGAYDIVLDYTPEPSFAQPVAPTAGGGTPDGPSVFTALEEQLGLKLESIRADVDMFVVDSVSQPEPN